MTTVISKDIQSLVPTDKINDSYAVKRKILWGADGLLVLLLLLSFPAQADHLYYSHDIVTNIHADYIGGAYNKYKLVWGTDGTAFDVSLANPWPVQVASLPLPAGAATAANQTSQITQETTTASNTTNI